MTEKNEWCSSYLIGNIFSSLRIDYCQSLSSSKTYKNILFIVKVSCRTKLLRISWKNVFLMCVWTLGCAWQNGEREAGSREIAQYDRGREEVRAKAQSQTYHEQSSKREI